MVAVACRLARRPLPPDVAGWLPGFRGRAGALIAARGWRITAATAASNLTLWLVLLACLRGLGLSQAQVPWQTSLAAFAFVRLLTVLPVTPGGLGITELGLIGTLAAAAGHQASAQVTAAVLLYRAVTYLPPIPLGAIACLTWRHAPALIRSSPRNAGRRRLAARTVGESTRGSAPGTEKVMDLSASPWPATFDSSAGLAITVADEGACVLDGTRSARTWVHHRCAAPA